MDPEEVLVNQRNRLSFLGIPNIFLFSSISIEQGLLNTFLCYGQLRKTNKKLFVVETPLPPQNHNLTVAIASIQCIGQ